MIGSLGFWEIAVIVVLALLLFGPKKLPELGRSVGKMMREGQRAVNELKNALETETEEEEKANRRRIAAAAAPSPTTASASSPTTPRPPEATIHRQGSQRPEPKAASEKPAPEEQASGGPASDAEPEETAEAQAEGKSP